MRFKGHHYYQIDSERKETSPRAPRSRDSAVPVLLPREASRSVVWFVQPDIKIYEAATNMGRFQPRADITTVPNSTDKRARWVRNCSA